MAHPRTSPTPALVIAAVGDVHGHHHQMVTLVEQAAAAAHVSPDLVVQVGDFEPHRHEEDVQSMAAPARYRKLGDFPDFFGGRAGFPWPVLFVGGNHEPYGFLDGIEPGAEIAPGCRWIGRAGMVEHRGLRIAGLSGIFREDCWVEGRPPHAQMHRQKKKRYVGFTPGDIDRLLDLCSGARPDLLLLHEWPRLTLGPAECAQRPWSSFRPFGLTRPTAFLSWRGRDALPRTADAPPPPRPIGAPGRLVAPRKITVGSRPFLGDWPNPGSWPAQLRGFAGEVGCEDDLPDLRRIGAVVGSAQALELALLLEPRLVLCGHVHASLRATLPGGIPLRALGKVAGGRGAIALFRWHAQTGFEELEEPWPG